MRRFGKSREDFMYVLNFNPSITYWGRIRALGMNATKILRYCARAKQWDPTLMQYVWKESTIDEQGFMPIQTFLMYKVNRDLMATVGDVVAFTKFCAVDGLKNGCHRYFFGLLKKLVATTP